MSFLHEPPPEPADRGSRAILFGICVAILVTLGFQIGSGLLIVPFREEIGTSIVRLLLVLAYLLLMIWPVWILATYLTADPGRFLRIGPTPVRYHIAAFVGTLALSQLLQFYLLVQELYLIPRGFAETYHALDRESEKFYIWLLVWDDGPGLLLSMLAGALMPAVAEELLFRGLVQRSFERRLRSVTAIALTAFLFAALHLRPVTFIPLFALGAFLGYVTRRTGSVAPAMLGHFIFNASAIIGLYGPVVEQAGRVTTVHTMEELISMLPVAAIALLIFVLALWRINGGSQKSKGKSQKEESP